MTEESIIEEIGTSRISRRKVMKAGAVVGGTVWVAPVIDSFLSRAAGQSNPACAGATCGSGVITTSCPGGEGCFCFTSANGSGFCGVSICCSSLNACSATNTCPPGYVCLVGTCCTGEPGQGGTVLGNYVCVPDVVCNGTCPPGVDCPPGVCGANGKASTGAKS